MGLNLAMFNPSRNIPIPNFSDYVLTEHGDVYRVRPARKGHMANLKEPKRMWPVCHPRGTRWYVQLTSDSGKRHRINVEDLKWLCNAKAEEVMP